MRKGKRGSSRCRDRHRSRATLVYYRHPLDREIACASTVRLVPALWAAGAGRQDVRHQYVTIQGQTADDRRRPTATGGVSDLNDFSDFSDFSDLNPFHMIFHILFYHFTLYILYHSITQ